MRLLKVPEHEPKQEVIPKGEIDGYIKALSGKPKEAMYAANRLIPLVRDPVVKAELMLFAEEKKQWAIISEIVRNLKPLKEASNSEKRYPGYREKYYSGMENASHTVVKIGEKRTMSDEELRERVRKALG
jgi:hypothetical protein